MRITHINTRVCTFLINMHDSSYTCYTYYKVIVITVNCCSSADYAWMQAPRHPCQSLHAMCGGERSIRKGTVGIVHSGSSWA